jgi:hypothetical protein
VLPTLYLLHLGCSSLGNQDISFADELGLDRGAAEVIQNVGAGGAVITSYRWSDAALDLQFEQQRIPLLGSFIEFGADVDAMNLLGRRDFFQALTRSA